MLSPTKSRKFEKKNEVLVMVEFLKICDLAIDLIDAREKGKEFVYLKF